MTALCEFLLKGPGQISDLMSLALVALIFWGVCALYRSGHWIIAVLVFVVAFASDAVLVVKIFTSVGMPLSEALNHYVNRLSSYFAPWIVVTICFLAGSAFDVMAQRKLKWLPALFLGVLVISVHVLIITVGWEAVRRIPGYGWGLQYSPLLPLFLLISFLDRFPLKNITPPYESLGGSSFERWILMGVLVSFLAVCPMFTSRYVQAQIVIISIYAIAIYGLNILSGICGQLCAWQWAVVGVGAYTAAILQAKFGYNLLVTLPLAGLAAAGITLLMGLFSFLKNYHIGVLTVIFSGMVIPLAVSFESWTGGHHGLLLSGRSHQLIYYVTIGACTLAILFYGGLLRSRLGRQMVAVREEQISSSGQIYFLRLLAFTLSGCFAGIAGALFVAHIGFINPGSFAHYESVFVLCMLLIGAMGTSLGPILGVAAVILVQEYVLRGLDIVGARFVLLPALAVIAAYAYWYYFRIRTQRRPQTEDSSETEAPFSGVVQEAGA